MAKKTVFFHLLAANPLPHIPHATPPWSLTPQQAAPIRALLPPAVDYQSVTVIMDEDQACPQALCWSSPQRAWGPITHWLAATGDVELLHELADNRPATRADCQGGERPCPFLSCRYHLYERGSFRRVLSPGAVPMLRQRLDQAALASDQPALGVGSTRDAQVAAAHERAKERKRKSAHRGHETTTGLEASR